MTMLNWNCRDRILECGDRTVVMGILNLTPDSFSDGGEHFDKDKAIAAAQQMADEGADIIDIGGESTRPGSDRISADEEWERIAETLREVRRALPSTFISVDTYKTEVARRALEAGADIINDIFALRHDDRLAPLVARYNAGLILMHMQGNPRDMQTAPTYRNVVGEVTQFLRQQVDYAVRNGVSSESIVVDPGIGFGKTAEHNLQLLAGLRALAELNRPILVGVSRKAFIGKICGGLPPNEREQGTLAACSAAILNGASIVRVHNVRDVKRATDIIDAVRARA